MLSAAALTLLVAWVIALIGPFDLGKAAHVLLLVGLMLLLLAFMKARDASTRPVRVEADARHTRPKP